MARAASKRDGNGFYLRIVVESLDALLAPDAALLVTAERSFDASGEVFVDENLTGFELRGDAVRTGDVARPQAGDEALLGVVGDADRIGLVREGNDRQDRAEDLLACQPRGVGHVRIDGRQDVKKAVLYQRTPICQRLESKRSKLLIDWST